MALARKLLGTPKNLQLIDGDTDVFGDGSVTLVSRPGHTPGSQSLLVHLKNSGVPCDALESSTRLTHPLILLLFPCYLVLKRASSSRTSGEWREDPEHLEQRIEEEQAEKRHRDRKRTWPKDGVMSLADIGHIEILQRSRPLPGVLSF